MSEMLEFETMAQLFEYVEYADSKREADKEGSLFASEELIFLKPKRVYLNGVISCSEDPDGTIRIERIGGPLKGMTFNKEDVSIED